jgi:hypothetical protein
LGATASGTTCYVKAGDAAPYDLVGIYTYNGADWVFIGLQVLHNDTIGIQGGIPGEYFHLDAAELAIVTTPASTTDDGYLTHDDWNYFAAKADVDHDHSNNILYWNHAGSNYEPYSSKGAGLFDSDTIDPTDTTRLNYGGYFYATKLYSDGTLVSVVGHTHAESEITFTNITDNDVSITMHGFMPRLPNDDTLFLNGVGDWVVPAGSGDSVWERDAVLGTINPLTHTDKVAIGSDTPGAFMLHVTGNAYYTGFVTVNSDIRTKNINGEVADVLDSLRYITPIKFTYKADDNPSEHFGFSAQEVNEIFPSVAMYDEETDTYGIDAIGLAALAIKGLKELNKKLECEVVDLQLELKFLKRNFLNAKTSDN